MNVLVSYDSKFGNTEKLALAMADALSPANNVQLQRWTTARSISRRSTWCSSAGARTRMEPPPP